MNEKEILKELDKLKQLENKKNQIHQEYCKKFETFAESIKEDVISKIKSLISNILDVSFSIDYDPESGEPTMGFYFILDGEPEYMLEEDDKYHEIIYKDDFLNKLERTLGCGIFIHFSGNEIGKIGKMNTKSDVI